MSFTNDCFRAGYDESCLIESKITPWTISILELSLKTFCCIAFWLKRTSPKVIYAEYNASYLSIYHEDSWKFAYGAPWKSTLDATFDQRTVKKESPAARKVLEPGLRYLSSADTGPDENGRKYVTFSDSTLDMSGFTPAHPLVKSSLKWYTYAAVSNRTYHQSFDSLRSASDVIPHGVRFEFAQSVAEFLSYFHAHQLSEISTPDRPLLITCFYSYESFSLEDAKRECRRQYPALADSFCERCHYSPLSNSAENVTTRTDAYDRKYYSPKTYIATLLESRWTLHLMPMTSLDCPAYYSYLMESILMGAVPLLQAFPTCQATSLFQQLHLYGKLPMVSISEMFPMVMDKTPVRDNTTDVLEVLRSKHLSLVADRLQFDISSLFLPFWLYRVIPFDAIHRHIPRQAEKVRAFHALLETALPYIFPDSTGQKGDYKKNFAGICSLPAVSTSSSAWSALSSAPTQLSPYLQQLSKKLAYDDSYTYPTSGRSGSSKSGHGKHIDKTEHRDSGSGSKGRDWKDGPTKTKVSTLTRNSRNPTRDPRSPKFQKRYLLNQDSTTNHSKHQMYQSSIEIIEKSEEKSELDYSFPILLENYTTAPHFPQNVSTHRTLEEAVSLSSSATLESAPATIDLIIPRCCESVAGDLHWLDMLLRAAASRPAGTTASRPFLRVSIYYKCPQCLPRSRFQSWIHDVMSHFPAFSMNNNFDPRTNGNTSTRDAGYEQIAQQYGILLLDEIVSFPHVDSKIKQSDSNRKAVTAPDFEVREYAAFDWQVNGKEATAYLQHLVRRHAHQDFAAYTFFLHTQPAHHLEFSRFLRLLIYLRMCAHPPTVSTATRTGDNGGNNNAVKPWISKTSTQLDFVNVNFRWFSGVWAHQPEKCSMVVLKDVFSLALAEAEGKGEHEEGVVGGDRERSLPGISSVSDFLQQVSMSSGVAAQFLVSRTAILRRSQFFYFHLLELHQHKQFSREQVLEMLRSPSTQVETPASDQQMTPPLRSWPRQYTTHQQKLQAAVWSSCSARSYNQGTEVAGAFERLWHNFFRDVSTSPVPRNKNNQNLKVHQGPLYLPDFPACCRHVLSEFVWRDPLQ